MFVVESGDYKCTRVMKSGEDPTYLKNYEPGEAFGELALLYNAPRAATIECVGEGMLYSLDRNTFNHIVKDASAKKREQYEDFLGQVKILASMEPYERSKLADAFKEERYEKDQYVLKEVSFLSSTECCLGRTRHCFLLHRGGRGSRDKDR